MLSIMFACHKHFVCKLKTIRLQEVNGGGGGSPRKQTGIWGRSFPKLDTVLFHSDAGVMVVR